ncbi:MAG: hypothetical protein QXE81_02700 [Desulfurococcaceae archaeon]
MRALEIIEKILKGILIGLVYTLIFVIIIPIVLRSFLRLPIEEIPMLNIIFYLSVFISIGIVGSIVKAYLSILFSALSHLIGLLIIVSLLRSGIFSINIQYEGYIVQAEFEFKPLLLLIIGFGVISAIVGIFDKIIQSEE